MDLQQNIACPERITYPSPDNLHKHACGACYFLHVWHVPLHQCPTRNQTPQSHSWLMYWGLFIYEVSQKWGSADPRSPLISQSQKMVNLPSHRCQKKSENGKLPLPPHQKSYFLNPGMCVVTCSILPWRPLICPHYQSLYQITTTS